MRTNILISCSIHKIRSYLIGFMWVMLIGVTFMCPIQAFAQDVSVTEIFGTIRGKVIDEKNAPVIGATVFIKELNKGCVTDIDGQFIIPNIHEQNVSIKVSCMGMKTVIVDAKLNKNNVVVLKEDNNLIDEVVVTGIFRKAKESYTGSVSTITSDDLKMYKGQNLLQTLKNIDASINFAVNNVQGSNPNVLPQINIRGNASLPVNVQEFNEGVKNDINTPLIIMDGFEITLTKLMDYNDDEIESINILKDASATAIYGSRGANGVIVVISKKPEAGKIRINGEVGLNLQLPDLSSYDVLNAKEKLQLEYNIGLYDYKSNPVNDAKYKEIYNKRLYDVLSGVNTDWVKKPVTTGVGQRYNLRLEGGNNEFRWGTSLGYNDIKGAMKGSSRATFNGSITLMYTLKNLSFRNYTSFSSNKSQESKYGSFSTYVKQQPYYSPYDKDGKLVKTFPDFNETGEVANPLYAASLNKFDKSGYNELINNFSIDWNILKELILRGQFGVSLTHNTSDYYLPAEDPYFTTNAEYATDEGFLRRGIYTYGSGDRTSYDANLTLSYNKTFNDVHQLYIGANYAINELHTKKFSITAEGFSNSSQDDLINARQYAKDGSPSGTDYITRRVGLTTNVNYTYDYRYYVDLSYRVDGSSSFGSDNKYAPFWSAGIGWNLHNEKFMKDKTPFNTLRLRTSYGETGTQQASATGTSTIYKYSTTNKYMNWNGAILQGLGNPDLTWQKTDEFNIGIDFTMFDNRLKATFDAYSKVTSNLLSNMNLPLSTGFPSYVSNVGEVKNTGWETSVSYYIIRDRKKRINWIASGQLTYNKNRITKLSDAIKAQNEEYMKQGSDISNLFFEGYPQNSIYAVKSLGIDPSTGNEVFVKKNGEKTTTWDASDKVFLGCTDPKYRGNFSSTFIWNKFTFNVNWGFYWGGKVYNSTLLDKVEVSDNTISSQNVDRRVLEARWYKPGDLVFFKRVNYYKTKASSRFVMEDNVLNLQSVSLQYRLDTPAIKHLLGANSIIFAVNMSDLLHFSTIKMERGTSYPYTRTIQGSVKLSF